jgi:hypothetical protein
MLELLPEAVSLVVLPPSQHLKMNFNQGLDYALRPLIQSIALPVAAFLTLWALGALVCSTLLLLAANLSNCAID